MTQIRFYTLMTVGWTAFVVAVIVVALIIAPGDLSDEFPSGAVQPPAAPAPPSGGVSGPSPDELFALGLGGLPQVVLPPDNPITDAKVELGKLLFFDRRMSGNSSISCSTCHEPNQGWGQRNQLSLGYPGTLHWRNAQTIINTGFYAKLNSAGSALSLESQAKGAWTGALAGNLDAAMAEERLRQIPEYVRRFNDVFGSDAPSFDDALRAVAAFEATITSRNVPFDNYLNGDTAALSESALRGVQLVSSKGRCLQCHGGPLFTDSSFHNIGVPMNPEFEADPLRQIAFRYEQRIKGVPEEIYRTVDRDLGLFYTTKQDEDKGKFRTPSLREVGQTGPYMHNGMLTTLTEVVEFYNRGGGDDPNKSPLMRPLNLSGQEITDIVAFLDSLTGDPIIIERPELPEYEVLP